MRARPPVLSLLACTAMVSACSTGAIDDGGSSFSTTLSTTFTTTTNSGDGDGDPATETGHGDGDGDPTTTGPSEPSCDDGELNQGESDVDCGGPCSPCATGQACAMPSDCVTMSCIGGMCTDPACDDGVANGEETDVDCGGPSCPPCADGLGCAAPSDCVSEVCAGSFCAPPNCGDGVLNGEETDVDCGGPACTGCLEGEICIGDSDCVSQYCPGGQCAPADCLVDADCDGFDGDCTNGVCSPDKTCQAAAANEGGMCDDGDLCSTGEQCSAGNCSGGAPVDCSGMSDDCNLGVCNAMNGQCQSQPANDNNPCDDANACTVAEVCNGGQCLDPNDPGYIFYEDFADNGAGWQLGTEWQIGSAAASNCASACPGNDPGTDHTPDGNNGVAGMALGGCTTTAVHADYCLTSPIINTNALPNSVWLTFWRHLHSDYPSYMTSSVQVFDGNGWATVWGNVCCSCVNDAGWALQAYDVTPYKNPNFRVRFCKKVESGGAFTSGGWNIDDVTIAAGQCTP